jgi:hypothetical protein
MMNEIPESWWQYVRASTEREQREQSRREEKAAINRGAETPDERKAREDAEAQRTDQRD